MVFPSEYCTLFIVWYYEIDEYLSLPRSWMKVILSCRRRNSYVLKWRMKQTTSLSFKFGYNGRWIPVIIYEMFCRPSPVYQMLPSLPEKVMESKSCPCMAEDVVSNCMTFHAILRGCILYFLSAARYPFVTNDQFYFPQHTITITFKLYQVFRMI